ncbi:HK97-gp10 family putative phage morphogenesis protein, partial [Roseivivax isoporae]
MVKNLAKFQRRMRAIPLSVRLEVVRQLEKEADKIVKLMKAFAPKGATRQLVESIGWTWGDAPKGAITVGKVARNEYDRIAITIYAGGGDAFYAKFQEFGTVNMAANPFFFPVWRAE